MSKSILDDAFRHHLWATERIINACSSLPMAQLNAPCLGTYGSILDTLRHTVESDRFYATRFPVGQHLPEIAEDAETTFAEMRMAMAANGEVWLRLLVDDLDPDAETVSRSETEEYYTPYGVRLAQVLHHGTDHRSQICTALTTIGIEPPQIDVWGYAEEFGRERTVLLATG
jgi:uncharacterized damage-inducible protein DinB